MIARLKTGHTTHALLGKVYGRGRVRHARTLCGREVSSDWGDVLDETPQKQSEMQAATTCDSCRRVGFARGIFA